MSLTEFLATGTGAALIGFAINEAKIWLQNKRRLRSKDAFINGMRSAARVYACMQDIKERTKASRVLLIEITNGGNHPKPGSVMYARAIEAKAASSENERTLISKHDNVRIDDAYIQMCIHCYSTKTPYIFIVKDHKDCLLKSIYIDEDVRYSEIYYLYTDIDKKKMFILSVSTIKEDAQFDDPHERAIINLNVSQMISEFHHFSEVLR